MSDDYCKTQLDEEHSKNEYVQVEQSNGEVVRFNRVWGKRRFTDEEVELLIQGLQLKIDTPSTRGIIGSLDFQEYNGKDYFGFAPWDAIEYTIEDAPFPIRWNGHEFSKEEEGILRSGKKLLLLCTSKSTGSEYSVNVSYMLIENDDNNRWGIHPHFDEFEASADEFTRETCLFRHIFGGKTLTQEEISIVRDGGSVHHTGIGKTGNKYKCTLSLKLDEEYDRWMLKPKFRN